MITLKDYEDACNYPSIIDPVAVEKHLRSYMIALGIDRHVVRLERGWRLDAHPSLARNVTAILDDFRSRRDASDATHRFACWGVHYSGWWGIGEISWLATTAFGARQTKAANVSVVMYSTDNPLIAWLEVNRPTALEHLRPHDTHEPIMFGPGIYEVRRQREYTPEGFRQVQD